MKSKRLSSLVDSSQNQKYQQFDRLHARLHTTQNFEKAHTGAASTIDASNQYDYATTTGGGLTGKSMEITTGQQTDATGLQKQKTHTLDNTISADEAVSSNSRAPRILGSLNHNFDAFKRVSHRNQIIGIQKTALSKLSLNQSYMPSAKRRRGTGA